MSEITPKERANAIRFLSMDAVQHANSGHPGMPMGMADIAEVLWHDVLRHDPLDPAWPNRDRFVLSNGHGCMLLYALLHLTGYELSIEDLKQFRQLHSKTPGHPEYGDTPGVETTTGPLGQGLANAVGMAIAEKHMAAQFNRDGFPLVDHFTYCFVGDGCLMEGISHEACSIAGTLGLGKLIVLYDDNGISIDGKVGNWFTDQTALRFESYGWHVIPRVDGHDATQIATAIKAAQTETNKPSIICCQTIIGWGAPTLAGTANTHGAPLGAKEITAIREKLAWPHEAFSIPKEIYAAWNAREKGKKVHDQWLALWQAYQKAHSELAKEWIRRIQGKLPANWSLIKANLLNKLQEKEVPVATRKASQWCLNEYALALPELMGGSADLTESNCTNWDGMSVFKSSVPSGRYIHYGVREFGMSAIMNGMALYKGLIPFGGTFLTFSDYAKNAIRLAALMRLKVIFVYTHDSIGLGEDGPTHQPIEHLPSLRLIPRLSTWRPCDSIETAIAWSVALEHQGPTCLLFSRQNLPYQQRTSHQISQISRGAYSLLEVESSTPDFIFIATGSEVSLAIDAARQLQKENIHARVISMPSVDVFMAQDVNYQQSILPDHLPKVVIEAAASDSWYRIVGKTGLVIGIDRFGASAPAQEVYRDCGLTVENIIAQVKKFIVTKNSTVDSLKLQINE